METHELITKLRDHIYQTDDGDYLINEANKWLERREKSKSTKEQTKKDLEFIKRLNEEQDLINRKAELGWQVLMLPDDLVTAKNVEMLAAELRLFK